MIRLVKRRITRYVMDIYLPKEIMIRGEKLKGQIRVSEVKESVYTKGLSINHTKTIGYEFLWKNWEELDKQKYDFILELAKGWGRDYVGDFKIEEKIIGISFK